MLFKVRYAVKLSTDRVSLRNKGTKLDLHPLTYPISNRREQPSSSKKADDCHYNVHSRGDASHETNVEGRQVTVHLQNQTSRIGSEGDNICWHMITLLRTFRPSSGKLK